MKYGNTRREKNKVEDEKDKNGAKKLMLEQLMHPTCYNKNENQKLKLKSKKF